MHPWKQLAMGSANADRIIDDANTSWTDEQIQNAKAAWRGMISNLTNAINERNDVIAAIKAMPSGDAKSNAISDFNSAESVFMSAYQQAQPLIQEISSYFGDELPSANSATFGIVPVLAITAILAASAAIAYIASSSWDSYQRYAAIRANPEVAKYDKGSSIFSDIGTGAKYAILAVGAALALSILLSSRKKA